MTLSQASIFDKKKKKKLQILGSVHVMAIFLVKIFFLTNKILFFPFQFQDNFFFVFLSMVKHL